MPPSKKGRPKAPERMQRMKAGKKLKSFKVETLDGSAHFIFFTQAEDHKKALRCLQTNSIDYKRIANKNSNLTIKVIELK